MTLVLQRGANIALPSTRFTVSIGWAPLKVDGQDVDVSAFLLQANGKVRRDEDFVFYGSTVSPCGAVQLQIHSGECRFSIDLSRLPKEVEKVAFTVTLAGGKRFGALQRAVFQVDGVASYSLETSGMSEAAVTIGELYKRNGAWKCRAVGQGFNGGLAPLATSYGVDIADDGASPPPTAQPARPVVAPAVASKPAPAPAPQPAPAPTASRLRLDKTALSLEKKAPALVSLAKSAQVSLVKHGLDNHTAKVAICMDVSGSMSDMFNDGTVQAIIERVLGLGINFDDDGAIDVFAFAETSEYIGELELSEFRRAARWIWEEENCGGSTSYAPAIEEILSFYDFEDPDDADLPAEFPVYVLFVTDGENDDHDDTIQAMRDASHFPVFFQFVGIGGASFNFLERLDNMRGRLIDNANFFEVDNPARIPEKTLYDKMMAEYPQWLTLARRHRLVR
jgi:stress response protein SCP2